MGIEGYLQFWVSNKMPLFAIKHTTFLQRSSLLEEDSFHCSHVGIPGPGHLVELVGCSLCYHSGNRTSLLPEPLCLLCENKDRTWNECMNE